MSRLLSFYRRQGTDNEGRSLAQIWSWSDDDFESVHDFIQWMFPLPEPSQFNSGAPLLTDDEIAAFQSDPILEANLTKSFERILSFLGLCQSENGKIIDSENFADRIPDVWAWRNHNWLRISRILRSLTLLGMESQAGALYEKLNEYFQSKKFPISMDTFQYWTEAVESGRHLRSE
jgi:hypothetical protein